MLLRKALLLSGAVVLLLLFTASRVSADGNEEGDKEKGEDGHVVDDDGDELLLEKLDHREKKRSTTHRVTSTTHRPTSTTHRTTSTTHRTTSTTHRPTSTTHQPTSTTHRTTSTTHRPTSTTHRPTSTTHQPTSTTHRATTTTRRSSRTYPTRPPFIHTTTYDYPHEPHDPSKKHHGKGYGRYDDDDDSDEYGEYDRPREIGRDGQHPGEYGQDYADFGPVYGRQESMEASMYVWIRAADDWEQRGESRYRNQNNGRYGARYNQQRQRDGRYNNRNDGYGDDDDNYGRGNDHRRGDRKKRSHSRVKFPVHHFKDIKSFSRKKFPPLISIFPWLPIFYDRITYQTFIFSPTGGIYILPPLINFYGQRFAVAQLIKWGYASLVSSGAPPPPSVDVAPLVQPVPAGGPAPGGPVAAGGGGGSMPTYDTRKNRFNGGVRTEFPDFKPRYAQRIEETGYGNERGASRNTYGADSNYGGTGRQEIYERGGSRGNGGYNY